MPFELQILSSQLWERTKAVVVADAVAVTVAESHHDEVPFEILFSQLQENMERMKVVVVADAVAVVVQHDTDQSNLGNIEQAFLDMPDR